METEVTVTMSQKYVELVIGRLATDEEFRRLFQTGPAEATRYLREQRTELTRSEVAPLNATDASAFGRVTEALGPRLQKASLRSGTYPPPFERRPS